MSFYEKHGKIEETRRNYVYKDYIENIRIKPDTRFRITAQGQFSDASIVPSFLKNQIFEFQGSGKLLDEFSFNFTGNDTLGLANANVRSSYLIQFIYQNKNINLKKYEFHAHAIVR